MQVVSMWAVFEGIQNKPLGWPFWILRYSLWWFFLLRVCSVDLDLFGTSETKHPNTLVRREQPKVSDLSPRKKLFFVGSSFPSMVPFPSHWPPRGNSQSSHWDDSPRDWSQTAPRRWSSSVRAAQSSSMSFPCLPKGWRPKWTYQVCKIFIVFYYLLNPQASPIWDTIPRYAVQSSGGKVCKHSHHPNSNLPNRQKLQVETLTPSIKLVWQNISVGICNTTPIFSVNAWAQGPRKYIYSTELCPWRCWRFRMDVWFLIVLSWFKGVVQLLLGFFLAVMGQVLPVVRLLTTEPWPVVCHG